MARGYYGMAASNIINNFLIIGNTIANGKQNMFIKTVILYWLQVAAVNLAAFL